MGTFPIILKTVARVIHLLGKQGLGFSGHRESIYGYENMAEVENVSGKCAENPCYDKTRVMSYELRITS